MAYIDRNTTLNIIDNYLETVDEKGKIDNNPPFCSICEHEAPKEKKTKFCPFCGARMDGDTDG